MENWQADMLVKMKLAPYIQKAMALIGKRRRVGGNQFRHAMATMAILIDYKYLNSIVLKASIVHDLLEDVEGATDKDLLCLEDGPAVLELVKAVTRLPGMTKENYLMNIRLHGSLEAKILKLADRISNITDLHIGVDKFTDILDYIEETRKYILPIADDLEENEIARNMGKELRELLEKREKVVKEYVRMMSNWA